MLNIVVGQRGEDSVEVEGGQRTSQTAAQLGKSVEGNAGTGEGEEVLFILQMIFCC